MALYNNGFPVSYPYYSGYQQGSTNVQQNTGITWVQGESAAKSWFVAPNTTTTLWDSESQTIYLKSADASGMPSMKVIDYTVRDAAPQQSSVVTTEYATKADVDAVRSQVEDLRNEISGLAKKTRTKEVKDE